MSDRRTFPNRPASVRAARHFVLAALGETPESVTDAVAIAVSELATNCVLHAHTEFTVAVEKTPTRVRVEVTDAGSGIPTERAPDATELSGRGILLVNELSDEWGVITSDDRPGKSVWFTVAIPVSGGVTLQNVDL